MKDALIAAMAAYILIKAILAVCWFRGLGGGPGGDATERGEKGGGSEGQGSPG